DYDDVSTAYNFLTQQLHVPAERIIVQGHSLGGAMAIDLAAKKPLAGLIAESAFVTAFRVRTHWALLPFDRFRNLDKITSVHCPVLVIHGVSDGLIGSWHGRQLFARAHE